MKFVSAFHIGGGESPGISLRGLDSGSCIYIYAHVSKNLDQQSATNTHNRYYNFGEKGALIVPHQN